MQELHKAIQADVRKDCAWLVKNGYILLNDVYGHATYYPGPRPDYPFDFKLSIIQLDVQCIAPASRPARVLQVASGPPP